MSLNLDRSRQLHVQLSIATLVASTLFCQFVTPCRADEVNRNQNWTGRSYRQVFRGTWKFMVEEELAKNAPEIEEKAIIGLVENLEKIMRLTPARTHGDFTRLTFYLMDGSASVGGGRDSGLTYYRPNAPSFHPNLDPAWNDVIVVFSAKNYTNLTDLWASKALMHEMAHAYHLHHWAENDPEIMATWEHAVSTNLYRGVKDVNGKVWPEAYALKNQLEYFAELSAAYFVGINYYPYDRATLAKYDPKGYQLIDKYWQR
jgi:hypothetical protein